MTDQRQQLDELAELIAITGTNGVKSALDMVRYLMSLRPVQESADLNAEGFWKAMHLITDAIGPHVHSDPAMMQALLHQHEVWQAYQALHMRYIRDVHPIPADLLTALETVPKGFADALARYRALMNPPDGTTI